MFKKGLIWPEKLQSRKLQVGFMFIPIANNNIEANKTRRKIPKYVEL